MPWQLSASLNTGDLDASAYDEVKIINMYHRPNEKLIVVSLEYGNTVDGSWVAGHLPASKAGSHTIQGQKYDDLITTHMSADKELTYAAAKRALYEHLVAEGVISIGNITSIESQT